MALTARLLLIDNFLWCIEIGRIYLQTPAGKVPNQALTAGGYSPKFACQSIEPPLFDHCGYNNTIYTGMCNSFDI